MVSIVTSLVAILHPLHKYSANIELFLLTVTVHPRVYGDGIFHDNSVHDDYG